MNVVKLDKRHRKTYTKLRRFKPRRQKSFLSRAQMAAFLLIALLIVGQHLSEDNPIAITTNQMFANPASATPVQTFNQTPSYKTPNKTQPPAKKATAACVQTFNTAPSNGTFPCNAPRIIDGDTMDCGNLRIRLASIDTPEMPGHCAAGRKCVAGDPYAAKEYLANLTRGSVTCERVTIDKYGRTVARCSADGRDVSCAMVKSGHAVERYGRLSCSGNDL